MVDTNIGRPSLFLASHDKAHPEHLHQHHLFHRANKILPDKVAIVQSVVTEIVATVSVIQQFTVDSTGKTIGFNTFTADSTGGTSYPPTNSETTSTPSTASSATASPETASSPYAASSTGAASQLADNAAASSSSSTQSLLSAQDAQSTSVTTPASSIPTTFASFAGSNATSSIIAISSNSVTPSPGFYNSSSILSTASFSPSGSSITNLPSSTTTFFDEFSTLTSSSISTSTFISTSSSISTSSLYSTSSSTSASSTSTSVVPVASTGPGSGNTPASTGSSEDDGNSNNSSSAPSTATVVGGVVGGVAGAAIIIFLLMFLIRWKRRNRSMLALGDGDGTTDAAREVPPSQPPGGMAERSSFGRFAVPAALAALTGSKRASQRTTMSSTAESERGFYRVSGRKLPSVLQSGGDGYGGGVMEPNTLSGPSFYPPGFFSESGAASAPPVGASMGRDSGVPIMREGPARLPITEQSPFADVPNSLSPRPPRRPDAAGRVPSTDGSQRSRFTEEV